MSKLYLLKRLANEKNKSKASFRLTSILLTEITPYLLQNTLGKQMKISHKVPLISTLIIVLAFSIFSFFQYNIVKNSLYSQTESDVQETSIALGGEITNWLDQKVSIIQSMSEIISRNPTVTRESIVSAMSVPNFNKEFSLLFGALDIDGKPISNKPDYNPEGWDGRMRPWWAVAKKHRTATMTKPYVGHSTKKLLISAVANIYENNNFVGAFGGDIELDTVSKAVNSVNFNDTGYAFLMDADGNVITHPDKSMYNKNISEIFQGNSPTIDSALQETMINNVPVFTSFHKLENFKSGSSDWYLGVVLDKTKVLTPARKLGRNAIIAALIAALLSSIVFYSFMKSVLIDPVHTLTEQSNEISLGDFEVEIDGLDRNDEVGELSQAIERLRKSLQMAMEQLMK